MLRIIHPIHLDPVSIYVVAALSVIECLPKFPPNTGALALIAVIAPILLSPMGLLRNPLIPCHIVPPIACKIWALALNPGFEGRVDVKW